MKIFFAGSIRGGRQMLPVYIQIIALLKKMGHVILSEHVASPVLEEAEAKLTDEEIFNSDIQFIDQCECLVADVTIPSVGVGYEICHAVTNGKKVFCLHKEGAKVSAMVLGNRDITSILYRDIEGLSNDIALKIK